MGQLNVLHVRNRSHRLEKPLERRRTHPSRKLTRLDYQSVAGWGGDDMDRWWEIIRAVSKSLGLYRQCSGPRVVGRWIGSAGRGIADTAISSKPLVRSYGY